MTAETSAPLEWRIDDAPVAYPIAVERMESRAAGIRAGTAPQMVWLLEHPPLRQCRIAKVFCHVDPP